MVPSTMVQLSTVKAVPGLDSTIKWRTCDLGRSVSVIQLADNDRTIRGIGRFVGSRGNAIYDPLVSPATQLETEYLKKVGAIGGEISFYDAPESIRTQARLLRMHIPSFGELGAPRTDKEGNHHPHLGVDFHAEIGTPVFAPLTGKVYAINEADNEGTGLYVMLSGENGMLLNFFHLSAVGVDAGAQVNAGETIAAVGMTGNARRGSEWYINRLELSKAHLHLEVWKSLQEYVKKDTAGEKTGEHYDAFQLFLAGTIGLPLDVANYLKIPGQ